MPDEIDYDDRMLKHALSDRKEWCSIAGDLAISLRRCREDSLDLLHGSKPDAEWVRENIARANDALARHAAFTADQEKSHDRGVDRGERLASSPPA